MKISTILNASFLFLSILMTSCYYDCDESKLPRNTYLLPNDAKAAFVYNGNDTIRFLKNNSDTIVYISGKIDTSFREVTAIRECDGEIAIYEEYKLSFISLQNSIVSVSLQYPQSNPTINGISITYGELPINFFLATEKFNNVPDIDSLNINGKYYIDVFILYNFNARLYYNKENGIIKIITDTEKLEIL